LSLLNTCQISQKCSEEVNKEPPSEVTSENNTIEEVSAVGPFFDQTSESSTKLDVFTVKPPSPTSSPPKSPINVKQDSQLVVAGKCGVILTVPSLLVALLYLLMTLQAANSDNSLETPSDLWANFNETRLSAGSENLLKIQKNHTKQAEIDRILRNVYVVINKFQEEHKDVKIPTFRGQYLFKSPPQNVSTNCLEDPTTLKAFDLFTVVLGYFAVVFYTKLTEVKLPKTDWSLNVNKCIVAFSIMWTPEVIETLVSRLITVKQPNIFSAVLLLVGNLDRVYAAKRNISMYKSNFCKMNAFIQPQVM